MSDGSQWRFVFGAAINTALPIAPRIAFTSNPLIKSQKTTNIQAKSKLIEADHIRIQDNYVWTI